MLVTLFRTAILYLIVIICMRIMGKRQVGELQPGELVVTIMISEMASIPMQDLDRPIINGIIAIFVLVVMELLLSIISLKSHVFRRMFSGKHAVIIKDGVVDQEMMKKLRISIDDLLESLRQEGYFNIENIAWAVMETSGKLSIQPVLKKMPVTREDMNIPALEKGIPVTVISDGKFVNEAFKSGEIKKDQIMQQLRIQNLAVEDVFLMTESIKQDFLVIKKELKK